MSIFAVANVVYINRINYNSMNIKQVTVITMMVALFGGLLHAQEYITPVETWESEEIQGSNYHGFAFNKDWEVDFTVESQDGRYSLSEEDIAKAERLIQKRIAYVNRNHENQPGKCPIIDEHLKKYTRQYVGFTDINGYHIAWVNFIWDESITKERFAKDIILTEGGCSYYWHVKVNLDTEKVYGLEVNDPGTTKYLPRVKKPMPRISRPKRPANPQRIRKTGIIHNPNEAKSL